MGKTFKDTKEKSKKPPKKKKEILEDREYLEEIKRYKNEYSNKYTR
jgi:hypothetical protein